jgi:5-methylcytosine-specific restriction endonuclease McrA
MSEARKVYQSMTWERISRYVRRVRAGGACEHCGTRHGAISSDGRSIIRLACAHLNGNVRDLRLENLRALCPTCHCLYDQMQRLRSLFDRHPQLQGVLERRCRPARKKRGVGRGVAIRRASV